MRSGTRKQGRQTGGKILGKGFTGKVITVSCTDKNTLCYELNQKVEKGHAILRLYTPDMQKYRATPDTAKYVFDILTSRDNIVVKQFPTSAHRAFLNEMEAANLISELKKKFLENNTAFETIQVKGKTILGLQIANTYYILNKRCEATVLSLAKSITADSCKKMIATMLDTLVTLQEHKLSHNDIKPNNIMKCGEAYMLIDWERMLNTTELREGYISKTTLKQKEQPYGSDFETSPIAMYIFKKQLFPPVLSYPIGLIHTILHNYPFTVTGLREYLDFYTTHAVKPMQEFLIRNPGLSDAALFDRFHKHFDVFALGTVIAQLYFIQRGKLPHLFLDFAACLLNPLHHQFVGTAKEAKALFRRMF